VRTTILPEPLAAALTFRSAWRAAIARTRAAIDTPLFDPLTHREEQIILELTERGKRDPLRQALHQARTAPGNQEYRIQAGIEAREPLFEFGARGKTAFVRIWVSGFENGHGTETRQVGIRVAVLGNHQHLRDPGTEGVMRAERHRAGRLADGEYCAITGLSAQRGCDEGPTMSGAQRGVEQFQQGVPCAHRAPAISSWK